MGWTVANLLIIHCSLMGIVLLVIAIILWKHNLFKWTSAGFWAWSSFLLYYFLNPAFSLWQNDLYRYYIHLDIAGGVKRGFWILFVAIMGIISFFYIYIRTKTKPVTWNLRLKRLTVPMLLVCFVIIGFGVYSLLSYRALILNSKEVVVEEGRFVGEVSGYESIGYIFLFIPLILTTISDSRYLRVGGFISSVIYVYLALPYGWSRFVIVSILLAISIADTVRRNKGWPHISWLFLILILTVSLQQRGHTNWELASVGDELINLASDSINNISSALGSQDASMLATWYLESYVKDTLVGYDYGLRLLNYVISGWIPYRLYPNKYFIVDWLDKSQPLIPPTIEELLYGAKSTLLGSFYCEGGIFTVILMAGLCGFLCKKLDGMLTSDSPLLVKTTGIAWMCVLWMIFGSSDTWGIMMLGIIGLPSIALWLVAPKGNNKENQI